MIAIGHESGAIQKNWQRHRRIALVYPNTYPIGMTNLGFQRLYQVFNEQEGFLCERVFLPPETLKGEKRPIRSCESGRSLQDFDVIAFSVSFETDYVNVIRALQLSQIPLRHQERRSARQAFWPIILAGGCGVTVNPEPLADFVDLYCIGEGEDFVKPFCAAVDSCLPRIERFSGVGHRATGLAEFLHHCRLIAGAYIPSDYEFVYEGNRVKSIESHLAQGPKKILRLIAKDLDAHPTQTVVVPIESPFRDMFMVETGRGCKWACRFCAAGYIYRFPRERSEQALKAAVNQGLEMGMRIGLVGSDMSCHGYIWDLMEYILDQGGEVSLSSIRVEAIDERMAKLIARSNIKTMTLAPDAGSFRLRRVLNKNMPDEMIVEAAGRLLDSGIKNLKLYFIIGLPTEEEKDLDELVGLVKKIRAQMKDRAEHSGLMGTLSLSLNPFIPKPGTPFQWVGMEPKAVIESRFRKLRRELLPLGHIKLELESYRSCYFQAFLSRADRRAGRILERMLESGKSLDHAAKDLADELGGYQPKEQIHRTWGFEECLPWGLMDHGFDPGYLQREMERGYQTKLIPNCAPETCRLCGVC